MKKLFLYIFLVLIISENANTGSVNRNIKLDKLFEQLKNSNKISLSLKIEMSIWNIWSTHPTQDKLTLLLAKGSDLMSIGKLESAHKVFSTIILSDPNWAEGWNKRATVFYLMGRYQDSLNDIDEVLKREHRHFGALSGQGLVHIKLENYEKAIESYLAAKKIYPSIRAAEVMIPQLQELIKKDESI